MAPFVATEWGAKAVGMMRRIKAAADPRGMLNPGVVLSEDPDSFLHHLKSAPTIEPEADRCIECGYCERVCPSRDLTTTPRQRIVIAREMVRQLDVGTPAAAGVAAALGRDIGYDVRDTCAGDGLCELACPVDIDTGALVKKLRATDHAAAEHRLATAAVQHWATAERLTRTALGAARASARLASAGAVTGATSALRRAHRRPARAAVDREHTRAGTRAALDDSPECGRRLLPGLREPDVRAARRHRAVDAGRAA